MDVPVHSVQVKGFEDESRDVLLLDQSIYGAKQAHRQFNSTLKSKLASIGFHSTEIDDSLYSKWVGTDFVHIHMHVDDGLVVSNSKDLISQTRASLSDLYDVKWNSNPTEHLGIKIARDRQRRLLHLSQESYLQNVLDRFGMENSNPVSSPLLNSTQLDSPLLLLRNMLRTPISHTVKLLDASTTPQSTHDLMSPIPCLNLPSTHPVTAPST